MINNFYQSKAWINLLKVIKSERLTENGELICEFCHKPIIKKYDCIGHHKIPIDDDNINDINITLNPDNIMLVHHRCHNIIHNKLGMNCRQVFVVYGSPLSGKTTYVKSVMNPGDMVVDMDNIWQCISGCDRYVKPNRLKENVFTIHNELIQQVERRLGFWLNAYVVGGYPLISQRERLIKRLGAREIFIDTEKNICEDRLSSCTDRNFSEWKKYIDDWWEKFSPTTPPG